MKRIPLSDGQWFDLDAAICFEENGSGNEKLYCTRNGSWVGHWQQWGTEPPAYIVASNEQAAKWLIKNEYFDLDELPRKAQLSVAKFMRKAEL
jgi:hypothetical protein